MANATIPPRSSDPPLAAFLMAIVFLRHAATEYNKSNRWMGKTDQALSDEGIRQAAQVAEELSATCFEAIYSSPLKRAVQTAEAVLRCQSRLDHITLLRDLEERGFGELEGCVKNDYDRLRMDHLSSVEPVLEFRERLVRGLRSIDLDARNILLVSHSTVFATLAENGFIVTEPVRYRLQNAEWVLIKEFYP